MPRREDCSAGTPVTSTSATQPVGSRVDAPSVAWVGWNSGDVKASYATGLVSGGSTIGGLVGDNTRGGTINDSYWDTDTSGPTTVSYGRGQTTANLQAPTDYTGIYRNGTGTWTATAATTHPGTSGRPASTPRFQWTPMGSAGRPGRSSASRFAPARP